jgi:hypothetical protein
MPLLCSYRGPSVSDAQHAARSKNLTRTASNGNSMRRSSLRRSTPASRSAVTSPRTAFTSRSSRRAVSRMDSGPAPASTLRISQRLAVSTCHSSSGVAKLIRLASFRLPDARTWAPSRRASFRERTSRTTVFTIPPVVVGNQPIVKSGSLSRGISASAGAPRSLSFRIGSLTGHSMPMAGSFQRTVDSHSG